MSYHSFASCDLSVLRSPLCSVLSGGAFGRIRLRWIRHDVIGGFDSIGGPRMEALKLTYTLKANCYLHRGRDLSRL